MAFSAGDKIIAPGLPNLQVFTASGTWTKPAGLRAALVEVWGGGGAGGGVTGAGSGQGEGGGGGSGAYARKLFQASDLSATEAVTVGAGGTGVSAGNGNGGATSSFKTVSCTGGGGGAAMTVTTGNSGAQRGSGGTATGGDLNFTGSDGVHGRVLAGQPVLQNSGGGAPGGGASSFLDFGQHAGLVGKSPGGGGSGAYGTTVNQTGGAGAPGMVVVTTYF